MIKVCLSWIWYWCLGSFSQSLPIVFKWINTILKLWQGNINVSVKDISECAHEYEWNSLRKISECAHQCVCEVSAGRGNRWTCGLRCTGFPSVPCSITVGLPHQRCMPHTRHWRRSHRHKDGGCAFSALPWLQGPFSFPCCEIMKIVLITHSFSNQF